MVPNNEVVTIDNNKKSELMRRIYLSRILGAPRSEYELS